MTELTLIITLCLCFSVSLAANFLAGFVIYRGSRRLLQFDDLLQLLVDDIATNIRYFKKLEVMPLISDTPEVRDAHKNMVIMGARLEEFFHQMEEQAGRPLIKRKPDDHRPKVA